MPVLVLACKMCPYNLEGNTNSNIRNRLQYNNVDNKFRKCDIKGNRNLINILSRNNKLRFWKFMVTSFSVQYFVINTNPIYWSNQRRTTKE